MKTKRKKLIDKLDELTKILVKNRDKNRCQFCGKKVEGQNCHWSHVIPVSHSQKLKWDLNNSMVLCFHHHINFWHLYPTKSGKWFEKKFPMRYNYLKKQELKGVVPIKIFELEELAKKYQEKVKKLKEKIL